MSGLEEKLEAVIKEQKFTVLEMIGFSSNPNLALLAGALIGYQLCLKNMEELIDAPAT